jgi:hypothetical protein
MLIEVEACVLHLIPEPNGNVYNRYGFDYLVGNMSKESPLLALDSKKPREFHKKLLMVNYPLKQCGPYDFAKEGRQIHGGCVARSREASLNRPMSFYEAVKHFLLVLTRKGRYSL